MKGKKKKSRIESESRFPVIFSILLSACLQGLNSPVGALYRPISYRPAPRQPLCSVVGDTPPRRQLVALVNPLEQRPLRRFAQLEMPQGGRHLVVDPPKVGF